MIGKPNGTSIIIADSIADYSQFEICLSQEEALDTAKKRWSDMGHVSRHAHIMYGRYRVIECMVNCDGRYPIPDMENSIVVWDAVQLAKEPLYVVFTREGYRYYPTKALAITAAEKSWDELPGFYRLHGVNGRSPVVVWEHRQAWDEDELDYYPDISDGNCIWSAFDGVFDEKYEAVRFNDLMELMDHSDPFSPF